MSRLTLMTLLLSLSTAPFLGVLCFGQGLWQLGLSLSASSTELLRGDRLPLVERDET
ncbi:hypothetical protein NBE99_07640 [Thermosynechococcus sp. HN-54]|uniref:hypothetical protein n=1 Tax=Thermosynechococcus sp. HN-54 TaxID=2933959 RepID=UPI00202CD70F|nr:hypothetical protein [Thermosynechococcus sp. HN-54]URR34519.1 hypothetical protein NBE99_07640 [Thermosynechococcus sp. HN-54]